MNKKDTANNDFFEPSFQPDEIEKQQMKKRVKQENLVTPSINTNICAICKNPQGRCGMCGGHTVEIRGKHPGDEKRQVCPQCLRERLDLINEVSSFNYGVGYNNEDWRDNAPKPYVPDEVAMKLGEVISRGEIQNSGHSKQGFERVKQELLQLNEQVLVESESGSSTAAGIQLQRENLIRNNVEEKGKK